ncbi:MAG TPA: CBS domain-containing protein [Nevskiaceae bacterium]|nr:CBS domain-containing protein [Nevskiaceae bacterium]
MKVSEVMSPNVCLLDASATAYEAAQMLKKHDIGVIPVAKGDRLIGVVTDRDIVVRVIAEGLQAQQVKLERIASNEPKYCYDDEDCSHVAANMDQLLIRRLPVVNRDKRLVGIVSIEDIRPRKKAA